MGGFQYSFLFILIKKKTKSMINTKENLCVPEKN